MTGLVSNTTGQNVGTWSLADASAAALTFTSVSVGYTRTGNTIHAYGTFTYPTTATTNLAGFTLPFPIPNTNYIGNIPQIVISNNSLTFNLNAILTKNSSPGSIFFYNEVTNGLVQNVTLSGAVINFNIVYPAS